MTSDRLDRALLLARTTRNLRASQVVHRARLRAQRFPPSRPVASSLLSVLPVRSGPAPGWPATFRPLDVEVSDGFPGPEENAEGRFTFLNGPRDLGWPVQWDAPEASRLWRYHLHYMEWAWSFTSHPDRSWAREVFGRLWRSWERSAPFGRGDEWSPYVASLRAWVLCGVYTSLVDGSEIQPEVDASLARHARFLRWHVEHDVGGNHLLKNLKALVGLAVFLGDDRTARRVVRQLERQLSVQVLPDGGHYERSPSYHCQVLGDLIDIHALLTAAGTPAVPTLGCTIDAMRTWLGLMRMPDGDVPLFNDCVLVGRARISALSPGPAATDPLTVLAASGYVVMRPNERLHLVADVGDPCPPDLPAHAHADCLSFELAVDGRRFIVDSGTSTYQSGPQRAHERSTLAHNTLTIDRADQTEVWATFRAARLAHGRLEQAHDDGATITVTASHDGYLRLPGGPVHRRTWEVSAGRVEITDEVLGQGTHQVESRLHLSASHGGSVSWTMPPGVDMSQGPAKYATGFGSLHDGQVMAAHWRGDLPVKMEMELHLDAPLLRGSTDDMNDAPTAKGRT